VRFSGVSVYRMAGDRIAESWYVYDLMGLLQQLGVLPAPAATA
jgi:predicted ester cyclase